MTFYGKRQKLPLIFCCFLPSQKGYNKTSPTSHRKYKQLKTDGKSKRRA